MPRAPRAPNEHATPKVPWAGSTREARLPDNWHQLKAQAHARNPRHVCHLCGGPGGDTLDHVEAGDDHSLANLEWAHDRAAPHCHRYKSSREGNAAQGKGSHAK